METVGHENDKIFGTVHTAAYNVMKGTQKGGAIYKSKADWHTYEVNWEQDRIQFAVDNQVYYAFSRGESVDEWPFDQEFHLIMNIAVGGTWGGAKGIDEAAYEGPGQVMEVDWIRVYSSSSVVNVPGKFTNTSSDKTAYTKES